jgi:hypothetical protein
MNEVNASAHSVKNCRPPKADQRRRTVYPHKAMKADIAKQTFSIGGPEDA